MPDISYPIAAGTGTAYFAAPPGGHGPGSPGGPGPWPGVVVIHEAFGLNDDIRRKADEFAAHGYLALAPDLYHGKSWARCIRGAFRQVRAQSGPAFDALDAARAYLAARDDCTGKTGVVGFCMGGTLSFYAATLRPLGAAVTFYGGGVDEGRFGLPSLIELAPTLQAPWLGCYGDLDAHITVDSVERLRTATAAAPVPAEVVRYGDADHGFHCDDRPGVFNAAAAHDAWQRTLLWFDHHLGG